ncbi:MAG: hypothetical protein NC420_10385 [Eubacterium sp.]|nr:hypothetical protein [Eubacterium sp.]MCM1213161.1 hypothetical protein [Lachnospiraceae bacterium]MCM1239465.1 hypothetical protein [Lachnospiraceae bacterium]
MKRMCMVVAVVLLALSGILIYKNASASKPEGSTLEETEAMLREYREGNPNGLTQEQIREILKEYAESNPERLTGEEFNERVEGNVVSYGESGVGFVNHETGEVILYVTNP